MISKYDQFAKDVGVIIPTGSIEAFQTIGQASGWTFSKRIEGKYTMQEFFQSKDGGYTN